MKFILEAHFEHPGYNAIVHLVTPVTAGTEAAMELFISEFKAALLRRKVINLREIYFRIDGNPILEERQMEYYRFFISRATAYVQIEEFMVDNPDQTKNLYENLIEKMLDGEDSKALIGPQHNIPVRVMDKDSRNPIMGDIYYFGIEHLRPK